MPKDVDAFLEHYGVKGMRWGVRKETSDSDRLAKIEKQLPKLAREKNLLRRSISAETTLVGAAKRADAAAKVLKLEKVKDQNGNVRYEQTAATKEILKNTESKVLDRKITRRAVATTVATGASATAAMVGAGILAKTKLSEGGDKVAVGLFALAALQAAGTLNYSAGIVANHIDAIRDAEAKDLKRERAGILKRIDKGG